MQPIPLGDDGCIGFWKYIGVGDHNSDIELSPSQPSMILVKIGYDVNCERVYPCPEGGCPTLVRKFRGYRFLLNLADVIGESVSYLDEKQKALLRKAFTECGDTPESYTKCIMDTFGKDDFKALIDDEYLKRFIKGYAQAKADMYCTCTIEDPGRNIVDVGDDFVTQSKIDSDSINIYKRAIMEIRDVGELIRRLGL
tara:strand:+ start:59 stop:649 length:591 start_codon:yes stop_codon:yes gene_type:complete